MTRRAAEQKALAAIARHGALLVYPIANRKDPPSLWHELHPRSVMHWAWNEGADVRVAELWQLRERLARSRAVVYSKWYRGRAVFFSQDLFAAMLSELAPQQSALTPDARALFELLEDDSPQSTKLLRAAAGLRGRESERVWVRSMKELWEQLWVVGTGEVEDGAFPSLELGATRWIFEALWEDAAAGPSAAQRALLAEQLARAPWFAAHWRKIHAASPSPPLDSSDADLDPT
jgi:hypothetical protein